MQALILAVLSSAAVSIVMRLSEGRVRGRMGLFLFNYLSCTLLAAFFTLRGGLPGTAEGLGFTVLLGLGSGFLYLYSLVLFRQSVGRNGLVMSSTFLKLGVLVPTVMAILFFREVPGIAQTAGFLLALGAILLLHFDKNAVGEAKGKGMLLVLLVASGLCDAAVNIFDKLGAPAWKDGFLAMNFLSAALFAGIMALKYRDPIGWKDVLFGIGIGVPNYFSSRFLLGALQTLPAVVVYPAVSVGTIVVITLCGVLAFGEKLNLRKCAALMLIFAALALLNL